MTISVATRLVFLRLMSLGVRSINLRSRHRRLGDAKNSPLLPNMRGASNFLGDTPKIFLRRFEGAHPSPIRFKDLRGRHFCSRFEAALTRGFVGFYRRLRSGSLKIYETVAKTQNSVQERERSTRNQSLTPIDPLPSVSSCRLRCACGKNFMT